MSFQPFATDHGESGQALHISAKPWYKRAALKGYSLPQSTSRSRKWVITVQVVVRDNNVDQALRALKKKMQREGIFREMKLRRHFEKPSEKKAREKAEAVRRHRKLLRKRLEREGF